MNSMMWLLLIVCCYPQEFFMDFMMDLLFLKFHDFIVYLKQLLKDFLMNPMMWLLLIVCCYPQELFMDFMMNWFSSINFIR